MMVRRILRQLALAALPVLPVLITGPAQAGGIAFRLVIGAPPDPDYQEVAYDGNAAKPPRGYSPGYGYPVDYMKLPSLEITNWRPPLWVADQPPLPGDALGVTPTAALFRIHVPEDAEVFFSGDRTAQRGSERLFVSPPLEQGQSATYEVRARWQKDGKEMGETRRVIVHPGDRVTVDFLEPKLPVLPEPRKVEKP